MNRPRRWWQWIVVSGIILTGLCMVVGMFSQVSEAAQFKVLVVMSYDTEWDWVKEIIEGIEAVLGNPAEIRYVYLDTMRHPESGPQKAQEAYTLYQEFQPDGVIAADDNAQSMFVVPFLKDKVKTPVIFCGVNAEPSAYGYPATNVSGILERVHFAESMAFLKQLVPSVKSISYLMKESSTSKSYMTQFEQEAQDYPLTSVEFKLVNTMTEAVEAVEKLKSQSDVVFLEGMEGLLDSKGAVLTDRDVIPVLTQQFGKPTICANGYTVKLGVLGAVQKTGQEQGKTAAKMLLDAMNGAPISNLPITRNHQGKHMLNVDAMKQLGIQARPIVLRGVELVKTEQ